MKAILTKYLSFTDTKPARIKASAEGVKSITYGLNFLENSGQDCDSPHIKAAKRLATVYSWPTTLASGQLANGDHVHCFIPDKYLNLKATAADIERHKRIAKDAIGF